MSALAALLMILSGSLHAVVNALVKGGRDKMAARAATDGSSAVVMLPLVAFVPLPTGAWGLLALSAVIHAAYLFALVRAYEAGDFSAAYPAVRGIAPVVTAALSVGLLGERVGAADLAGVALIGGSICALVAGRHLSARTLGWSALTGIAVAAYTVVDAAGVRAAPTPASYIVWLFATMGPVVIAAFALATRGRVLLAMRSAWRPGAIAGALSIAAGGAARDGRGHRRPDRRVRLRRAHRTRAPPSSRRRAGRGSADPGGLTRWIHPKWMYCALTVGEWQIEVVGGQQRLTRFQRFLAALHDHLSPRGGRHRRKRALLPFNQPMSGDDGPLTQIRLLPTPADRDLIHAIIEQAATEVRTRYPDY